VANLTRLCYRYRNVSLVSWRHLCHKDFRNPINQMFYQPSDAAPFLSRRPSAILLVSSPRAPSKLPALTYASTTCSRSMTQRPPFRNIRWKLLFSFLAPSLFSRLIDLDSISQPRCRGFHSLLPGCPPLPILAFWNVSV
jgi:hypothetical protein